MFLEQIDAELEALNEDADDMFLDFLQNAYEGEYELMKEELELTDEEYEAIMENFVRRVSSDGSITKMKSRKIRKARATMTTGLSRAALKQRARKAARTKRANPGIARKALRKRRKALRRRRQMGL